jgi:hypothetical protein
MRRVFRWLRENGRYLSPHGAGDLLLDLSVVLRNLFSMQIIMGIFILMFLLAAQSVRVSFQRLAQIESWHSYYNFFYGFLPAREYLWWSPYTLPALALFVFAAIPAGWAYWLLSNQKAPSRRRLFFITRWQWLARLFFFSGWPWLVPIVIFGGAVRVLLKDGKIGQSTFVLVTGAALVSILTLTLAVVCALIAFARAKPAGGEVPDNQNIDPSDIAGNLLSRALKVALVTGFGLLGFALIDTLGQTAYVQGFSNWKWLVPLAGPIALATPLAPFAQWVVANLGGKSGAKSISIPLGIVAGIGAAMVIIPVLILLDGLSHAVAYAWQWPLAPAGFVQAAGYQMPVRMQSVPLICVLIAAFILSWLASRSRRFLNSSSLHALYTARLVRAYLGASNPERYSDRRHPVTDPIADDDLAQEEYWKATSDEANGDNVYGKSAPIHLLNVTINETYDGRSELEQRDRKGLGMAIGPAGISAGVKHHVVFNTKPGTTLQSKWWHPFKRWRELRTKSRLPQHENVKIFPTDEFRVFNYPNNVYEGQLLALELDRDFRGGFHHRTGLPHQSPPEPAGGFVQRQARLLVGFRDYCENAFAHHGRPVRPAVEMVLPRPARTAERIPVAFPGDFGALLVPVRRRPFENMGGYELIRRRLPLIVIIDAEADPQYTFEGLANLVQKTRLDFGAEIEFCNESELDEKLRETPMRRFFGTLEQLKRGTWAEEPVKDPETRQKRLSLAPVDSERFSLAHAALAKIEYRAESGEPKTSGWLILIKPTLTGDEPADVLRYHNQHHSFPHETTANQWFNESQWESYRKLGEHIGMKVFGCFPPNLSGFQCPSAPTSRGSEPGANRWARSAAGVNARRRTPLRCDRAGLCDSGYARSSHSLKSSDIASPSVSINDLGERLSWSVETSSSRGNR